MEITLYQNEDFENLLTLSEKMLKEESFSRANFETGFLSDGARCFLAKVDGKMIGFVNAVFSLYDCEILGIATDEQFCRRGVGTSLLTTLEKQARNENIETINLEVRADNEKAIFFYLKNGYSEISVRKNYYHGKIDALIFQKVIRN